MTELCHIDIQCRFGWHTLFTDKVLQKILRPADDTAEQVGKPTAVTDRPADFSVDLRLLDLQYRFFRNACDQCHIRCSIPFLPCGIVGFDFCLFRIVLAYFPGGQIYAVFVKGFELLFGVCDMAVDMGGVNLLDFFKKGFTFETLVFGGKEVAFVNLSLFDDRTAFSYLSVLPGDFFLCAHPLPGFVKEYASGSYLYIRLREQLSFAENQVDMVVCLEFVVMECRHTFHAVPLAKQVCEVLQHLVGVKFGVEFRQGDDKLPCFDTLSCGAAAFKFLLTFPCKIVPKGIGETDNDCSYRADRDSGFL